MDFVYDVPMKTHRSIEDGILELVSKFDKGNRKRTNAAVGNHLDGTSPIFAKTRTLKRDPHQNLTD